MLKIDAQELVFALQNNSDESTYVLDLETGAIELSVDELISGEVDEFAAAARGEMPEKYLPIEPVSSRDSFQVMQDFVETVTNAHIAQALERALSMKRPFRNFQDTLTEYPAVRQEWFKFQDERFKELAQQWLRENNIAAMLI